MGLDGVELIMAYEEAFGVRFADQDMPRMRTPRDVIEFVSSRVPVTTGASCLTQRAFYTVRAAVLEMSPVERRQLVTLTPLSQVFPLVPPAVISKRLSEKLGLRLHVPVERLSTMGELAVWLAENAVSLIKRGEPWSRGEIAHLVRAITLAELGDVAYDEDARFVEDLGVS
jgi:hypothetical protein